jgi:hypothetical protein
MKGSSLTSALIGLVFYKKSKIIILIGMITAASYIGLRSYSKFEVRQNLEQIYRHPDVKITVIPQELFSKSPWSYLVASKDFNSGGTSSFSNKIYRDYLFFQMHWNVLKEIRKDNSTYIICESMKNKDNLTVFRTINNTDWEQVTNEKEKQLIISEFSS